jgi:hypothetical protein
VPAPLEYADLHVPPNVWTDPAMIARGKEIYTTNCAVCHGDEGDGKGPAGLALPLKPADMRDQAALAKCGTTSGLAVSEGGLVDRSSPKARPCHHLRMRCQSRTAGLSWPISTPSGHQGQHVPGSTRRWFKWDVHLFHVMRPVMATMAEDGTVGSTLSPSGAAAAEPYQ